MRIKDGSEAKKSPQLARWEQLVALCALLSIIMT